MTLTPTESRWLLANHPNLGTVRCAAHLERTVDEVRNAHKALRRNNPRDWPYANELWLTDNARDFTPEVLADHLRLPVDSVRERIDLLGLAS